MGSVVPTATPILGSALLQAALSSRTQPQKPASSGSFTVDDQALQGGFRYGEITMIAGASGAGKTTFAFHAIASHLLSSPRGDVAIIDSKGTFSPTRLRDVLAARLRGQRQRVGYRQSGYVYEQQPADQQSIGPDLIEEATSMLERVKVMRIFDVAGLVEAVDEIVEICEEVAVLELEGEVPREERRRMVADSEDGSEGDGNVDIGDVGPKEERHLPQPGNAGMLSVTDGKIGMLIIDTITTVFGPLMTRGRVQGQAMLTTFMLSLHHLTKRRQMCTILTNSVVGLNTSETSQYRRQPEEDVSIFSSLVGKPALGKSFTYLIDTSILLSALPKRVEDTDAAYGDNNEKRKAQYSGILEVVQDKHGTRAEGWAAFEIIDGVDIRPSDKG